jgi:hypothetical protein
LLDAPLWDAEIAEVLDRRDDRRVVARVREYPVDGWRAEILPAAGGDGVPWCAVRREPGHGRSVRYLVTGDAGALGSFVVNQRGYWFRRHTWLVVSNVDTTARAVRGHWWGWLLCLLATPVVTVVTGALIEDFVVLTPHLRGFRFRRGSVKVATVGEDLVIRPDDPDPRLWLAAWVIHRSRSIKP